MDWLHNLIDSSATPALTAFLLGLLTAISPCPLASNIAAIGFISKDIDNRNRVFMNGVMYTCGRIITYTLLGVILTYIIQSGSNTFGFQKFIGRYGELLLGPLLTIVGLYMLFGHKLNLPNFGFRAVGDKTTSNRSAFSALLLGVMFALAFCPTSGVLYFGMLIPMSVTSTGGWGLCVLYAIATALPVWVVAWVIAFSVERIGKLYGTIQSIRKWLNRIVGLLFVAIGLIYCILLF